MCRNSGFLWVFVTNCWRESCTGYGNRIRVWSYKTHMASLSGRNIFSYCIAPFCCWVLCFNEVSFVFFFCYSQVEVFGSFRTGLYLPTSDIDVSMVDVLIVNSSPESGNLNSWCIMVKFFECRLWFWNQACQIHRLDWMQFLKHCPKGTWLKRFRSACDA